MRRQAGVLEDHRAVDVAHPPPLRLHQAAHPAQQVEAVGAGPGRVGVREVLPQVAQAGRPQQRIGHGVGEDVGVAVTGQAPLAGQPHPAQHQRPPGVVGEGMGVEPQPDPRGHGAINASSTRRSSGVVIFMARGSPGTRHTLPSTTRSTRVASSEASQLRAWAFRRASARNACGVNAFRLELRTSMLRAISRTHYPELGKEA